jgi:hypothetical protein
VDVFCLLGSFCPAHFPHAVITQAGQRLLRSSEGHDPRLHEAVRKVLVHFGHLLVAVQIEDEGHHAAAIELAYTALLRFGACYLDGCVVCRSSCSGGFQSCCCTCSCA